MALAPVDASVVLPAAVVRAREAADAAQQAHIRLLNGEPEAPLQQDPPPQQDPVQQDPPQQDPPQQDPPQPQPQEQPDTGTDYERRYKQMKGRHDALKSRTDRTMTELSQRIHELERDLQSRPTPAPAPAPGAPAPSNMTVDQFREEGEQLLGTEMFEFVDRLAQRRAEEMAGRMGTRIDEVAGAVRQMTSNELFAYLDRNQAGWRDVNVDPQFVAWLNLRDPFSGAIRQKMLEDAFAQGDAQRVQIFFKSFIADGAHPAPSSGGEPVPTPPGTTPAPSNRISLTDLAAPGRAGSSPPPPGPGEKRIYKQSEIGRFFSDKARGMWAGRETEANQLEADIFAAQSERRVVPG